MLSTKNLKKKLDPILHKNNLFSLLKLTPVLMRGSNELKSQFYMRREVQETTNWDAVLITLWNSKDV